MATTSVGLSEEQLRVSFVRDIAARAELPPYATAEAVAIEVMGALTERLTSGGLHRLLEALPASIRPLVEGRGPHPKEPLPNAPMPGGPTPKGPTPGGPVRKFDRAELLERIADHVGVAPRHAEQICLSVVSAVRSCVPVDVAERVGNQFPADLKELWFAPSPPVVWQPAAPADELEQARREIYSDIERSGALPASTDSAEAFMAVLCIFSRRLSGGEARNLRLALPNTVRPLIGACSLHRPELADAFDDREFTLRVAEHLAIAPELATRLIEVVFASVRRWLPEKDVADVASQLPVDLRNLWLGW
jgi:uncharacterized protein (DUF2267 family)